jgi:mRNA-degrading endonuclease RelE of RelBE toxin-antitoxin system
MNAPYQVKLHPDARSDLAALDKALQRRAAKQLHKLKSHPLAGKPLGHKYGIDLTGYRSLYFGGKRYRIVYRVDEPSCIVWVIAIARRVGFEAYHLAARRAEE